MRVNLQDRLPLVVTENRLLFALIGLCVLVFAVERLGLEGWFKTHLALVPAQIEAAGRALSQGDFSPERLRALTSLVTSAFLHGSAAHLGLNMLFLWVFGYLVVRLVGPGWLAAIFFVSAIVGGLGHTLLNPGSPIPMIGASGAVMGLEGAYLAMFIRWRIPDPDVWPLAHPIPPIQLLALTLIGIFLDYTSVVRNIDSNVAYGAHIGGFLAGLFLGSLVIPKPRAVEAR